VVKGGSAPPKSGTASRRVPSRSNTNTLCAFDADLLPMEGATASAAAAAGGGLQGAGAESFSFSASDAASASSCSWKTNRMSSHVQQNYTLEIFAGIRGGGAGIRMGMVLMHLFVSLRNIGRWGNSLCF